MTQTPFEQCTATSMDGDRCDGRLGHLPFTLSDGSRWMHGRPEDGHYWNKISDTTKPVDTPPAPLTGEDATAPVTIELSIELELDPDEVWPDGDWPENWTAKDVLKLVLDTGSLGTFMRSWGQGYGADVTVRARGGFENGHLR